MFSIVFDPFCPPARIIAFDAMPLISVGPWVLCQFWGAADKQISGFLENCLFDIIWAYIKRIQKIWIAAIAAMDGHGEFPDLHPDLSQNLCWWMILNTSQYWILNSSNWYWTDTESIISVLYYKCIFFNEKRSFYHAFLKFRFNEPWPGPWIRTSRQSELGLALWVLLNVCVGPTLRWKAHLKEMAAPSNAQFIQCSICVFCCLFLSDQNYGCISTLEVRIANLLARKYP